MKHSKKDQEVIDNCIKAIGELVYEKTSLIKAYNYYHGKRDPEQFRHLEENYGIGIPTSIEFVPLTRKHIDVLVGEYLTIPTLPRVTCKDKETIGKILEEKKSYINDKIEDRISQYVNDLVNGVSNDNTKTIMKDLKDFKADLEETFVSSYEIASQNVLDWTLQDREIDFVNKRKIYLTDLLVTGSGYTRVIESDSGESINFRVLNPLHTFVERNYDSIYTKHSQRAVIRDYLSKNEILQRYGEHFTEEDIDSLDHIFGLKTGFSYVQGFDTIFTDDSDGVLAGYEALPHYNVNREFSTFRRIPVYDVEYLQTDKEKGKYITNRYRCISIGLELFIPIGKVENVYRPMGNPETCYLSINGTFYSDRNGDPFSLILATANLQD